MKNAHLRMGSLRFTKVLRDTTIDITLRMDRMIAEHAADNRSAQCHVLSVIGNDQEIAAIAAAIADEARFYATGPEINRLMITIGKEPRCFAVQSAFRAEGDRFATWLRSPKNCQRRAQAAIRAHAEPFCVMTIEHSYSTGSVSVSACRFYRSGVTGSGRCWSARTRSIR